MGEYDGGFIETERLILRPFKNSDACSLFEVTSDADVAHNAGWKPHADVWQSERMIEQFKSRRVGCIWAITQKNDGVLAGFVALSNRSRLPVENDAELGYALAKCFWGHGYMTEAADAALGYVFDTLGFKTVVAAYYDGNERSSRVLEKLGFSFIKRLIGCTVRYDGTVLNKNVYALCKGEYMLSHKMTE